MPSKLKKAIGAVKDQTSISLARVSSNTSSNLEVAVLKATTHDDLPVDQKYVNEVLHLVSSNKFHAAACARAIGKRIGRTRNWIVAIKSLILVLRIFQDGDPYFPREVLHAMKRGAKILNLSSFRDDSNSSPWDFTAFVRTFALYLDERLECFLTGKLQRRYKHGVKEDSIYQRTKSRITRPNEPVIDMKPAMLLDRISYWQRLLDRAIATRPTGAAKMNRLVQISFYAIVEESFELYKDISDGLTLVLDSFFHLQFQNCVTAFQTCVKAAKQFKELSDFYSLCKSIGVGRSSEYPSVQTISEELIEALQEFLKDQSSFPSNSKPSTRFALLPAPPSPRVNSFRSKQQDSQGEQSQVSNTTDRSLRETPNEMGLPPTSLEDLIKATEETGTCPAISIDLEAYSASQQDDSFRISDTGSTRSLPVTNSMVDLMSLWDWAEQDNKEQQENQQGNKHKAYTDSSPASENWELVLAETISSSASSPQPNLDTNTNFNSYPNQTATVPDENNLPTLTANSSNSWGDLVLFDQTANNHYNPFLQDMIELPHVPAAQSATSVPTFQAIPSFSMQNQNQTSFSFTAQNENDPFAAVPFCASFSSETMCNSSVDQQTLLHEQQLWLQNQNKIIAKHMT